MTDSFKDLIFKKFNYYYFFLPPDYGMAIIRILRSCIFFSILLLIYPTATSLSESEALLALKASFTNATILESWNPGTEPCDPSNPWIGILCQSGVVSGLRLGHMGLAGKIDVDALLSLPGLRSVGIMSNSFSGPIPDFHRMSTLKGLYLSMNQFSGEIPSDYFTNLEGMRKVWLSGNNFSGTIPSSLAQLFYLKDLHLEDNQFSGTILALNQSSLISLNLSNNNLEGEIPGTLSRFSMDSFQGNPGLCGENLGKPCQSANAILETDADNAVVGQLTIWVPVASGVLFLLMVVGIFVLKRRQEKHAEALTYDSPSVSASSVGKRDLVSAPEQGRSVVGDIVMLSDENGQFGLDDLMKAAAEGLGNGALGCCYKATLESGVTVVVKRIKEMKEMGIEEFDAEMRMLASLKHRNVLTPLAYHYQKEEKFLIYEFQPKGGLLFLLHGNGENVPAELNWGMRLKLVQGIAGGLEYIHSQLQMLDLPHGNLKSSNVLLTPEYEPLLVDYGFCSLIGSTQAAHLLTGYKSPEATVNPQEISAKCDVFCLGVIILEILTGEFPSQFLNHKEGGLDVVQWVRSAIAEGREAELLDGGIAGASNSLALGDMKRLLHIAAACTESDPQQRLDIGEANRRIEAIGIP